MTQLATIFEGIKEHFFQNVSEDEKSSEYNLIFAPFSTGFTKDDFLFLDSNNASVQVHKYLDELLEFSQISNTIPKHQNYWTSSNNQDDYLSTKYKTIIESLRLIDVDTLSIEMLYTHPVFQQAIDSINSDKVLAYQSYYELYNNLIEEIKELKKQGAGNATQELQIKLKNDNLVKILEQWNTHGHKDEIENKILSIIKDEIKRFIKKLTEAKALFETSLRTHPGSGINFYLTYCKPNNLYDIDNLKLEKIILNQSEIQRLSNKGSIKEYNTIFNAQQDIEIQKIEFEIIFVDVSRSWYKESLLSSPFWDINLLDKSDIDIPKITDKLIFIRNVDIQLKPNSEKNKMLFKNQNVNNLGPFIAKSSLVNSENILQLNSMNTSLDIERKLILDIGSQLQHKSIKNNANLIEKKQQQFVRLAPKLRENFIIKNNAQAIKAKSIHNPTVFHNINVSRIKEKLIDVNSLRFGKRVYYEIKFIDSITKNAVEISTDQIVVQKKNKEVTVDFHKNQSNNLRCELSLNTHYQFKIKRKGYHEKTYDFRSLKKPNQANQPKDIVISLKPFSSNKKPQDSTLQLIGVVSKSLESFPNPIKSALYI